LSVLTTSRYLHAAGTIGDYLLAAGGTSTSVINSAEVYQLVDAS
jgi:hypothetical protein